METGSRPRVLYVGHDAAGPATHQLGVAGFDARVCRDAASALAVAREFRPDVCLLAPATRAAGAEVAARLRDQVGGRAVVIVAVAASDGQEGWGGAAGFRLHLVTPADHHLRVVGEVGRVLQAAGELAGNASDTAGQKGDRPHGDG